MSVHNYLSTLSGQAALKVLYVTVRDLAEFRPVNIGTTGSTWDQTASVHDLLSVSAP
ncbi:MAG: hypothetical protein ACRDTE_03450 [Pseudonocardiaceae bacterium]